MSFLQLDNRLILYKYKTIRFSQLKYINYRSELTNLVDNAPYRYLRYGDTNAYKEYCEVHKLHNLTIMSFERFDELKKSIEKEGYDEKNIIVVYDDNVIADGQHRACVLCNLFGENASIKVLKILRLSKNDMLKFILPNKIKSVYREKKQSVIKRERS